MKIINPTDLQLNDEVVIEIKRVSKATTGGRRMRFRTIVVVIKNHYYITPPKYFICYMEAQ